ASTLNGSEPEELFCGKSKREIIEDIDKNFKGMIECFSLNEEQAGSLYSYYTTIFDAYLSKNLTQVNTAIEALKTRHSFLQREKEERKAARMDCHFAQPSELPRNGSETVVSNSSQSRNSPNSIQVQPII